MDMTVLSFVEPATTIDMTVFLKESQSLSLGRSCSYRENLDYNLARLPYGSRIEELDGKSKQLERNYSILRANYEALASKFESLKTEKQFLLVQLQKHQVGSRFNLAGNSRDGGSDNGDVRCEAEAESSLQLKEFGSGMVSCPDDENIKLPKCFGQEEPELNIVQHPEAALTSPENWFSFDSKDLFDQSCNGSHFTVVGFLDIKLNYREEICELE